MASKKVLVVHNYGMKSDKIMIFGAQMYSFGVNPANRIMLQKGYKNVTR